MFPAGYVLKTNMFVLVFFYLGGTVEFYNCILLCENCVNTYLNKALIMFDRRATILLRAESVVIKKKTYCGLMLSIPFTIKLFLAFCILNCTFAEKCNLQFGLQPKVFNVMVGL